MQKNQARSYKQRCATSLFVHLLLGAELAANDLINFALAVRSVYSRALATPFESAALA